MVEELDQALGAAPEPRSFFAPPPRFEARLELPAEVAHAEGLLFGARRLLVQLAGLLAARHEGIRGFRLVLLHESRASSLEIGLASATRDAERMARVLRERLAQVALAEPVRALRLEAGDFAPLQGQAPECSATTRASRGLGRAPRAAARPARQRRRARPRRAARSPPEHAWRRVEPGEWDPRASARARPAARSGFWNREKLTESEFTALAGPERIESGWWDGDDARRDYFVARLPNGALAWVFREAGANGTCMASLPDYAELHCLSNFSFLRGASHPEELVSRAQALGYKALALTDECSLAGAVRAHQQAKECGLPLILGAEILAEGLKLVLLATDRRSYGAISSLITTGRRRSKKGDLFARKLRTWNRFPAAGR